MSSKLVAGSLALALSISPAFAKAQGGNCSVPLSGFVNEFNPAKVQTTPCCDDLIIKTHSKTGEKYSKLSCKFGKDVDGQNYECSDSSAEQNTVFHNDTVHSGACGAYNDYYGSRARILEELKDKLKKASTGKEKKELQKQAIIQIKTLSKIPEDAIESCPPKRAQKMCDHLLGLE